MLSEAELNRIAYEVRGAALDVHRAIGPGCFESAYTPCLAYEMSKRGLEVEQGVPLTLRYGPVIVERAYATDFRICRCLIVEVKAIELIAAIHLRQLRTYLHLSGCPLGLLINFGALRLFEDGICRQVNNFPHGTAPYASR